MPPFEPSKSRPIVDTVSPSCSAQPKNALGLVYVEGIDADLVEQDFNINHHTPASSLPPSPLLSFGRSAMNFGDHNNLDYSDSFRLSMSAPSQSSQASKDLDTYPYNLDHPQRPHLSVNTFVGQSGAGYRATPYISPFGDFQDKSPFLSGPFPNDMYSNYSDNGAFLHDRIHVEHAPNIPNLAMHQHTLSSALLSPTSHDSGSSSSAGPSPYGVHSTLTPVTPPYQQMSNSPLLASHSSHYSPSGNNSLLTPHYVHSPTKQSINPNYFAPTLNPRLDVPSPRSSANFLFPSHPSTPNDGLGPFIPQKAYRPHTNSDVRRYVEEVNLEAPIVFEMKDPTQRGISLSDALTSRFMRLAGRDDLMFVNRGPSISIRLQWQGYQAWSRQIPTRDFRSPPGPITRSKLAKNVAKSIQRFLQEFANRPMEQDADPHYRVGPKHITLDDLILDSLYHVSMGSWQAHLRLKGRPRWWGN